MVLHAFMPSGHDNRFLAELARHLNDGAAPSVGEAPPVSDVLRAGRPLEDHLSASDRLRAFSAGYRSVRF